MMTVNADGAASPLLPSSLNRIFRVGKDITLSKELRRRDDNEACVKKVFWKDTIAKLRIKNVVAPMVDQSELAFRMFLRSHGAQLTYTPMIHAQLFVSDTTYRKNILSLYDADRPVIVQFCANNEEVFRDACRLVEGHCDGVDLNLGCPQNVAKRGHYGAFLQDELDLICSMISAVRDYCSLPISAKIRIRDDRQQTLEYARRLIAAGASMLTVHGRTREMKGVDTGLADWSRIKEVVDHVDVPVIANGNIQMGGDIDRCMAATGAAAVMSAEGILYNPFLFEGRHEVSWKVAQEYLGYASRFEADASAMRAHVFRICHHSLLEYDDLRQKISIVHSAVEFTKIVSEMGERVEKERQSEDAKKEEQKALELFQLIANGGALLDAYAVALTPHWLCKPYIRLNDVEKVKALVGVDSSTKEKKKDELRKRAEETGMSMRQIRKKDRRALQAQKTIHKEKKEKFPECTRCKQPAGQICMNKQCKKCCRWTCLHEQKACTSHHYDFTKAKISEVISVEVNEKAMDHYNIPRQNTLNPMCTGTSVVAIAYDTGVAIMSDTVVSYGKSSRYKNVTRQYRVNEHCLLAFSGDHADFHQLQNIVERQAQSVMKWAVVGQKLNPSALHNYLTSLLYSSRCKMKPFWNTLVVGGWEMNSDGGRPYLGVITQKGVGYQPKHCATGIAAMLLNQVVEDECRDKSTLDRAKAETILRKALELSVYHDCVADSEFEIGVVGKDQPAGVFVQKPIIGDWSIAETNCQYE